MSELQRILDFARQVTYEAGRLTLGYFYRGVEIIDKDDGSPVTIADREAELLIRRAIEKTFPDHGILGEEHGTKAPSNGSPYTWYIDPIDGTKSFIHGVPLYTNLLGVLRENRSVVGVVQIPALGEQLSAADGLGCHLNGRRVAVSNVEKIERAALMTTDIRDLEINGVNDGWRALYDQCRYPRTWGDAYGYYLVATGRAEIMIDARCAPYDVAPLPVIMREAGGAFFDWTGEETIFGANGAACNAKFVERVKAALSGKG